ncbi:MAG: lytic transglycosylase domain-containing protein [Gammaproteobacteria bacterium]|nr:lytic transglycosylase domain-containing protein [Gammaproteobacteria bacterium]MDH5801822.1 lytic transglycosylase domain-containing protein [Gammaproteobacteria bacterium]
MILALSWMPLNAPIATTTGGVDPELRQALMRAVNDSSSFNDRFHAEVWLLDMSTRLQRFIEDDRERINLLRNIHQEATRADLPPELVLAVIDTESAFNRWAISVVGAQGLMQVMPFWLKEIGREGDNLFSVKTNLRFGCTILKHYLDKEKGDLRRALARYNGSIGKAKYPNKVFKKLRTRWFRP